VQNAPGSHPTPQVLTVASCSFCRALAVTAISDERPQTSSFRGRNLLWSRPFDGGTLTSCLNPASDQSRDGPGNWLACIPAVGCQSLHRCEKRPAADATKPRLFLREGEAASHISAMADGQAGCVEFETDDAQNLSPRLSVDSSVSDTEQRQEIIAAQGCRFTYNYIVFNRRAPWI
jgi:hypothetical protein